MSDVVMGAPKVRRLSCDVYAAEVREVRDAELSLVRVDLPFEGSPPPEQLIQVFTDIATPLPTFLTEYVRDTLLPVGTRVFVLLSHVGRPTTIAGMRVWPAEVYVPIAIFSPLIREHPECVTHIEHHGMQHLTYPLSMHLRQFYDEIKGRESGHSMASGWAPPIDGDRPLGDVDVPAAVSEFKLAARVARTHMAADKLMQAIAAYHHYAEVCRHGTDEECSVAAEALTCLIKDAARLAE